MKKHLFFDFVRSMLTLWALVLCAFYVTPAHATTQQKPTQVRCEVEIFPNEEGMTFHLSKRLMVEGEIYMSDTEGPPSRKGGVLHPNLVSRVLQLDGVVEVTVDKYEIDVRKAKVFELSELITPILKIITEELGGPLLFTKPIPRFPVRSEQVIGVSCIVERVPNGDIAYFHLNKRVANGIIFSRYANLEREKQEGNLKQYRLMQRLLEADGVAKVTFRDYSIGVERGTVFDWKSVVPVVLAVISEELNDSKEVLLKEPLPSLPPTRYYRQFSDGLRVRLVPTMSLNEMWVHTNRRVSVDRMPSLMDPEKAMTSGLYQEVSSMDGIAALEFDGYEIKFTVQKGYNVISVIAHALKIIGRKQVVA